MTTAEAKTSCYLSTLSFENINIHKQIIYLPNCIHSLKIYRLPPFFLPEFVVVAKAGCFGGTLSLALCCVYIYSRDKPLQDDW